MVPIEQYYIVNLVTVVVFHGLKELLLNLQLRHQLGQSYTLNLVVLLQKSYHGKMHALLQLNWCL